MRALNTITMLLLIIGGINWLLVGLAQIDLVAAAFGGQDAGLSRLVYVLVGLSAIWQLISFSQTHLAGQASTPVGRDGTHRH